MPHGNLEDDFLRVVSLRHATVGPASFLALLKFPSTLKQFHNAGDADCVELK
jgi:hypothetical protein